MIALTLQFIGILAVIAFILFLLFLLEESLVRALKRIHFPLQRVSGNPILAPHALNDWETHSVFNPAAVVDDEGVVHLLYRAMGFDGLSKIGHAESTDGKTFTRRFGFPVYHKRHVPETDLRAENEKKFNPAQYTSGGGWGGCEDPRAVRIDDEVFMSYTAFEGWHSVRIALTSIPLDDFKAGKWNWKRPLLLSAPGSVEKNWVIFPEKIHGKFAVLHSVSPEIKIDYVENFDAFQSESTFIKSQNSPTRGGREEHWDNRMRGAAAPPMKTDRGWLLLYHAMDRNDPDKYKLGAMLLDLEDPTKIIARSPSALLSPDMQYENDWKPGVIYASGAVIMGDTLHVYYGGGDKYICAATANLPALLDWLTEYGKV
jgi:predicted GH43/DUF377 family glycosyl hydrolase